MKRTAMTRIRFTLQIVALFGVMPLFHVHAQDHWVTLPDGKRISANKSVPLFYSYTTENGKLTSLRTEDPQATVKVIVTLKDKPLALYKKKNALQKTSLASVLSSLQSVHSLVRSKISAIAQQLSAKKKFQYQYTVRREYYTVINGMALECNREMMDYLRSLPEVKNVQLDEVFKADLTQSVHQIRADIVQDSLGYNGDSVVVGEIDTGIDYNNPALGAGFGSGFRVIGGHDFANNDNDPMDDHGHGTHVAGIIGANGGNGLRGVAPKVKFLAVKVLDKDGYGMMSDIIAGVEYCMDPDGNPATDDGVDIISMSLGGAPKTNNPLDNAIDNATQAGILSVIAAGNDGGLDNYTNPFFGYTSIASPGTAASALTVGACDSSYTIADFSSKGPDRIHYNIKPEVVAPGVGILSTVLNNGTASWSGTSMATPHVTGVAALLKQQHRNWSPEQLKTAIVNSAKPASGSVYLQGNGCVDALRAATLGISVAPGVISFGIVDLTVDVWKDTVEFKVKNLRNISQNINLETQASLPAGVVLTLSQTSFTLAPMQETTVTAIITVPRSVPIINYAPYAYTGNIICKSDSDRVLVPFAVNKINVLTIECDREAWELLLYAQTSFFSIVELYGMDYKYIVPLPGGTYNLFAMLHASDEYRTRDTFYLIARKDVRTGGHNYISINHTDAPFAAYDKLDMVQDVQGNPVGGLDSCGVTFQISIQPTISSGSMLFFPLYTPRLGQWYLSPMDSSLFITVMQEIVSLQGDQALLLKKLSSSIKSQTDLALLSGPANLVDLYLKLKYDVSSATGPFIQTTDIDYNPAWDGSGFLKKTATNDPIQYYGASFMNGSLSNLFVNVYRLPNCKEIHLMSNKSSGVFDPMNYYSMSTGIGAFNDQGPSWKLSTSDFIMNQNSTIDFFERKPFRPNPNEYVHIQTLQSGDTISLEAAAPTPVVLVPKFQFSYPNDKSKLSVIQYTPEYFDDGGVIRTDGTHAEIYRQLPALSQQFTAQLFTKNGLVQGGNISETDVSAYNYYNGIERYTDRFRFLAVTDRYNLFGQYGQSTIDYQFNVDPMPHQDCILPTLDFFQILGDDKPVQWLRPAQDGKVHLIISDPKQNIDSVGIFLLENDGTEISLQTTHPILKEYFASIPKNISSGFHDVVARVHNIENNTFELITSPAFFYGPTMDCVSIDARVYLSTYTLDNLNSVHFNPGDTLKYTLTYKNFTGSTAKNITLHFPQTDYFTPVGNSTITLDSIPPGPIRGQRPTMVHLTLMFLGKKQPIDIRSLYTPSISWNSGGRSFTRNHLILIDFSGAPTSVTMDGNAIPKEYALSQNYPNPFNPSTTISYSLPENAKVKLEIYNLLGQKVATLVDETRIAGNYALPWNARNLASGIYFYRFQAGTYTATKKLLLLK